ncbi:MAG: hypothetical protein ACYDEQ_06650 [Desulfocucumaceae bacterium]
MISQTIPRTPEDQLYQFGMLYEKYVFNKLVSHLVQKYNIKTVCEFPYNELMGQDNNEGFRHCGCEVTRYRNYADIEPGKKFDLIWNFCEFEQYSSDELIIPTMFDLSKNNVLIITQNMYNVMMLHYWYHVFKRRAWDHGDISKMNYRSYVKEFRKYGLEVLEIGAFDAPWFVLDFYEGGKFFRGLAPKTMINTKEIEESFFEKLPKPFRILLSHHHYVLGQKRE